MIRRPTFVALLLVSLVAANGCRTAPPLPPVTGPDTSSQPLSFQVPFHDGSGTWDPAQDRGSVILLDVWATWCEPCRDALPLWQDLAKEYAARDFKVYALSLDEDPAQVGRFIEETKLQLPVVMDEEGKVAERMLKVTMMPTSFLIDRRGIIRHVNQGFAEEHLAKYQSQIEQLLGEKK